MKIEKHQFLFKYLMFGLGLLLALSLFKNISYPLLWADESMTAMGCERVLQYGYPKAHDGKNVVNDMFCNTPKVAVNAKDDAFIGGANWGQYYIGSLGYLLASRSDDMYIKTGLFRSVFAVIGLISLFIFAYMISMFFGKKYQRYLFICVFLLAELISISLILHLREVRYYSPALLFNILTISAYLLHRFHPNGSLWDKPFNKILFTILLSLLLWIDFTMFSPLFFILITSIGISELVLTGTAYRKTSDFKKSILPSLPVILSLAISVIAVYPLLQYFKTFEMKKMLDTFYHFNSETYWKNFSVIMRYFRNFELFWLMLAMKVGLLFSFKNIFKLNSPLFKVSNFLTLFFIIFIFSISNIPNPIFTRYVIPLQPIVTVIALLDFALLFNVYSKESNGFLNRERTILTSVFVILFGYTFAGNFEYIEGHLYEMTHQYKGPLDYTIPYIKSTYPRTDTLIIATNYEETSFMYYLKSKVIVGFVGNNLPEDTIYSPHIISYRRSLGSFFPRVFDGYLAKAVYREVLFPDKDIPLNNIPELNYDSPVFNHYFKTVPATDNQNSTRLIIR